ncbi:hypothetical protein [Nocardia farcinica]|uniref:hypothetical protein n=1 Tax=Nocardia farcinica TaxID=37329 RepID=UPI0018961101|nr:hypothetical protein [Nocardia farcinica]MBF6411228.1 hypothetical protein [Nocardia farcinica]
MPDQIPEFVSLDEYRAPVEPAARQRAEDLNGSYRLSHEALAMRHARTLSALRTVWASRRRHQKRASDMLAEGFGAAESRVRELEAERDKLARLLAAESARVAELEAKRSTLGYAAVDLRACDRRPQPVLLGPWDDEKSVREAWGDTEGVVLTELSVLPTEEGQADA